MPILGALEYYLQAAQAATLTRAICENLSPNATGVANDVLLPKHLVVVELEVANTRHHELERDLASARAAASDERGRPPDEANVVELLDAREEPFIEHRSPPVSATGRFSAS